MNAKRTKLWLKRVALSLSSLIIGFAGAFVLFLQIKPEPAQVAPLDLSTFPRVPEMEDLAEKIVGLAGLHTDIPVYLDTYNPHLCAYSYVRSRTIVLSEGCDMLMRMDGNYDWRNVGVVSHQVGHILNSHWGTSNYNSEVRTEDVEREQREAMEFAGWAIGRMGGSLDDAQVYIFPKFELGLPRIEANPDHLAAIAKGWRKGSGFDGGNQARMAQKVN